VHPRADLWYVRAIFHIRGGGQIRFLSLHKLSVSFERGLWPAGAAMFQARIEIRGGFSEIADAKSKPLLGTEARVAKYR